MGMYQNIEKAVEHYCKSTKCRTSSYNLNMSLIKRVCTYFWEVHVSKRQYNKEYLDSLYDYLPGTNGLKKIRLIPSITQMIFLKLNDVMFVGHSNHMV